MLYSVSYLSCYYTIALIWVVELRPGGLDFPVPNSNRISYIHLAADYQLKKQIHR